MSGGESTKNTISGKPADFSPSPTYGLMVDVAAAAHRDDLDDNGFAASMKERNRLRREREEAAVSRLRVQVSRLEASLAAESKRRLAAVQTVQEQAKAQLQQLSDHVYSIVEQDRMHAALRLDQLEARMQVLESRWSSDIGAVQEQWNKWSQELQSSLRELQESAAAERKERLSREGRLLQQLEDGAAQHEKMWKDERKERLASVNTLQEQIDQQERDRETAVRQFEGDLRQQLNQLEAELEQERLERRTQDEEIVAALNRYTQQLQKGLAFVSGV